jgi:hypothetical protein
MDMPHENNRLLKGGKGNIRMEANGKVTDRKTKNKMAG